MTASRMIRMSRAAAITALALGGAVAAVAAQGPGGFGGVQPERQLVAQFDKDGDKRLNAAERKAAREYLESQGGGRRGGRGFGPMGANSGPSQPGPRVSRTSVRTYPASVPFYDFGTLRTLFLDFENGDWEKELMAFKGTDIQVPATLVVDGVTYKDVGIKFRGSSSFFMVPEGEKHSMDVALDAWNKKQNIGGFRSLNLLNSNEDPSFLRGVLYLRAAREYVPAANANLVRVVINGENWGVYPNVEQVNKEMTADRFKVEGGSRWKVQGSPNARGGLEYFGEDVAQYKRVFDLKTKEDPKAWAALIHLTRVLNETPANQLATALSPILDIDNVLRFLALDNTLVNNDGYWVRSSDYNIYLDPKGVFHLMPHDINEAFAPGGGGPGGPGGPGGRRGFGPPPGGPGGPVGPGGFAGPGGGGGRGGRGGFMMGGDALTDPLIGLDDPTKPLRSKLLAVPELRASYLSYCKAIATKWLDWQTLGPLVTQAHEMIAADVRADTRKLETTEAFEASTADLKAFADKRRAYVLAYQAR
jgi:hypothetical protein